MHNIEEKIPTNNDAAIDEQEGVRELSENVKVLSPGRMVAKRFFRSKLSIIGLAMLAALFLFSFLGPLFTPWGEIDIDRGGGKSSYMENPITYTVDGVSYTAYDVTLDVGTINKLAKPSWSHPFGTDEEGMDVMARLMYGGRISLTIGFVVVILEVIIGVLLGGLAGLYGKWVDQLIMRIVDIFNCLPLLPILLITSALLEAWKVPAQSRIYYLMIILTVFGWAGIARLVRGQILSLREQEFMVAAECLGLPAWRKIVKHLVPNIMPQLIVTMTLTLGGIILTEATLSYLQLGVPIPHAAWGSMISAAQKTNILSNYMHVWLPPGICIVMAVLGFNFVGDGLRDAFDPKGRR